MQTEQKLSMLLQNSLELYNRCFAKNKLPNTNQFLRLCEDLRQAIESLLLLGIGLNPEEDGTYADHTYTKTQCLKDYIDKKLIAKIELDPHILGSKLSFDECRIIDRAVRKQLNDILSQPASVKKQEKQ